MLLREHVGYGCSLLLYEKKLLNIGGGGSLLYLTINNYIELELELSPTPGPPWGPFVYNILNNLEHPAYITCSWFVSNHAFKRRLNCIFQSSWAILYVYSPMDKIAAQSGNWIIAHSLSMMIISARLKSSHTFRMRNE